LDVSSLRYVALGGGSYHWIAGTPEGTNYFLTVDDLQAKPWLGTDPDSVFRGLRAAFDTAVALRDAACLAFVLGPLRSLGGESTCRLTLRYSLAVFPFIAGRPGRWGDLPERDRAGLVRILAELHQATSTAGSGSPRRGMELHQREVLTEALSDLEQPWTGGPFAERARRKLASRAGAVTGWLTEFDDLAARLRHDGSKQVVTHGEPHPGNIIRVGGRLMLIDWDTVALAPPERDLWLLDDGAAAPAGSAGSAGPAGRAGTLARYTALTGRAVDTTAISFYRLAWKLADIAAFTGVLRSVHQRTHDTEHAWKSLQIALSPAPPQPAGRLCGCLRRWLTRWSWQAR
jgi:spectinomycin phosphotransferase